MHDLHRAKSSLARVALLPPNCPWRDQYESIVIPKAQYEFLMQRVLTPRMAHYKILLSYLLWGGERFHNKSLLLPCHLIANFFGYPESSNTNTGNLLRDFQRDVLSQIPGAVREVGAHDWLEHQCRRVEAFHLGELQTEFDALGRQNGQIKRARDKAAGPLVYLCDGRTFTRRSAQKLRRDLSNYDEEGLTKAHPVSEKVIETMARVPASVFARQVTKCFALAATQVESIKDPNVRRSQEAILRRIDIDPMPRYSHSLQGRMSAVG